jgi:thymidylate synthase ThyX
MRWENIARINREHSTRATIPGVTHTTDRAELFTDAERARLAPYFTNLDGHVFALTNLPETVKGALFARYSRSAKSLRRLFLDEFADHVDSGDASGPSNVGLARAEKLYAKVFNDYGDDSVAQLGGAHIACEYASNILTKVLEWGRLMAYLEQSTRYVPYTDKLHGQWRYHVPAELQGAVRDRYLRTLDDTFERYSRWIDPIQAHFARRHPKASADSDAVHRSAIRAKALDTLRGMLPAATQSNVGIFGTGQAFEALLLRMRANPLAEVRTCADDMLRELRKVIPAFLTRVDQADRGERWSTYLSETKGSTAQLARELLGSEQPEPRSEVTLTDFDRDGELKIVAAALYAASELGDDQLLAVARKMSPDDRANVLRAYVGTRANRRHRPGRAFERTGYRFDVLTDYGAFRDLQRHRLLTIEWQPLSTRHGFIEPEAIREAGAIDDWMRVMDASAELYEALRSAGHRDIAPYGVAMAYRVRFYMEMNAREAMHLIELRTAPQGHPAYRRVCQEMHRLIADVAGHRAVAAAMKFADHSVVELERLGSERALERKRTARE